MKKNPIYLLLIFCITLGGQALISEEIKNAPVRNYFSAAATLWGILPYSSDSVQIQSEIECIKKTVDQDMISYSFLVNKNTKINIIARRHTLIETIDQLHRPTLALDGIKEWEVMSYDYYDTALNSISFLQLLDFPIQEGKKFQIVTRHIQDDLFCVENQSSGKKREFRLSQKSGLYQIRDITRDEKLVFQASLDSSASCMIIDVYHVGNYTAYFFPDGGVRGLVIYKDGKASFAKEWSEKGKLSGERDLIKDPIDYSKIKIIK